MSTTDDTNATRRGSGSNDLLGLNAPERANAERMAGYWRAWTWAVATRDAELTRTTDRRGRPCWECTVGQSTVQRMTPEMALHSALHLEFDGNVPEQFGLPKSTVTPLVWSGS